MDLKSLSEEQIYLLSAPIWEAMSAASKYVDYEMFSARFSSSLKNLITKERFESQCQALPLLTSLSEAIPVACIRRSEGVTVIFKQFSHSLEGEFIGQLTLSGTLEEQEVVNAQVY